MKRLLYYARIFVLVTIQYIKIRVQYRTDFFITFLALMFRDVTGFFGLWIIFNNITALQSWSFHELIFFYSFSILVSTPSALFFDNVWNLKNYLEQGTFIKFYYRPLNMMFYYMAEKVEFKNFNQLFLSIGGIIYASINLDIAWNGYTIAMFTVLFISASLVTISFMVISSAIGFWTINSYTALDFVVKLREYARYPLTIFNSIFKFIFTYIIPIGFISYYPLLCILRPGQNYLVLWATPVVGIVFFIGAYLLWMKGTRSYTGTGS